MENQPIVRLNFTCNRNWEDMQPVENGRFCNDCQKKVVDFTDKTNEEIAAYLISSATLVCGRFQNTQLAPAAPKPIWKRWFSTAAMFVAVFIGVKEASAQQQIPIKSADSVKAPTRVVMGEVAVISKNAQFPGGEVALRSYLDKNVRSVNNVKGKVVTTFIVEKDGSLTDIKVIEGLSKEADEEAIRVLKESPKWLPMVLYNGVAVRHGYTLPISFSK
ncbi:energy transducer TonB [uncultured Mucilaginibacter sp.]|uniref:energy transducer TonB n=1 Tax=uncultured Mucilaginibacter sp. TaxID=797541 RepID=UPI0026349C4B|nr:energy transducer TonB [uncultured Mucilaginibacter sp.]